MLRFLEPHLARQLRDRLARLVRRDRAHVRGRQLAEIHHHFRHRHRVGAEDLQERRLLAQPVERLGDRGVLLVALDVDEEEVLPQRARVRSGRDSMRVMLTRVLGERREQRVHRAGLVLRRHHERGAVAGRSAPGRSARAPGSAWCCRASPRSSAPARSARSARRPASAGDRRRALLLRRALRGLGVGGDRDARRASGRFLPSQPLHWAERLRVRIDSLDVRFNVFALRKKILLHPQLDLAADAQRRRASSRSRVRPTTPSVEFSTGTTVNCVAPDSALRKASSTDARRRAPRPRCRSACAPPAR